MSGEKVLFPFAGILGYNKEKDDVLVARRPYRLSTETVGPEVIGL